MIKRKRLIMIFTGLLVVALVALLGGILGKKSGEIVKKTAEKTTLRCAYDGTKVTSLYQVDAYLDDGTSVSFCSIYCATRWFESTEKEALYFTVIDEVTGQKFDASLGHFVESNVVTVPEVNNRIHAFYLEEDALTHAQQFKGKLVENPFGPTFVFPKVAQFDTLKVGAPPLPDSLPLRLAIFRPIFKENRLDVSVLSFEGENEGKRLLSEKSIEGLICDLPMGLLLAKGNPSVRIVRSMLKPRPTRPLFALVASQEIQADDFTKMERQRISVPRGVTFRFYAEYYLKKINVPLDKVVIREVKDVAEAWILLKRGDVSAALLRAPYSDVAAAKDMAFLADDRNLPWMSVLVVKQSSIQEKYEVIRRLVFGLEQAVLALNLKPDEFYALLQEQGNLPKEARKGYSMPIFETADAPAKYEVKPVLEWLVEKGLLCPETTYEQLVNLWFLPKPEYVGVAFCCTD